MKNYELYVKNPLDFALLNNGVSKVAEILDDASQIETLRFEIENFVCDGEYSKGLERILSAYLGALNKTEQQAVWVSGFFGSGKSHLVKMLRYLWTDYTFPDGAKARSLIHTLPSSVKELLVELNNRAKPCGGLRAAAGTLGAGSMENVRLAFLQLIFRANGLPENLTTARFVIWLRQQNLLEKIEAHLRQNKHDPDKEIRNFHVSTRLAEALVAVAPSYGDVKNAQGAIRAQFPNNDSAPTIDEMLSLMKSIFGDGKRIPYTLLVVDEVQQYIGDKVQRAMDVQEIAETCCKALDRRLLLVCTGQQALSGDTPLLGRLQARFTVKVSLSDTDVETVIRSTILAKKPEKTGFIKDTMEANSGEISRHLQNTKLATTSADAAWYTQDYPLLPVRRRFWEKVLRSVDVSGTTAQLRTQLKIVFEATRETANESIGHVVPADFIYNQIASDLLNTGLLQREYHETITTLRNGTDRGLLQSRLCALMFLVAQLPRSGGADEGVRATAEVLADLLVSDLKNDGSRLRSEIPVALEELVSDGKVMLVDNEYLLQTREGANWNHDFKVRYSRIISDDTNLGMKREELLKDALSKALKPLSLNQGDSRESRDIDVEFTASRPAQPLNRLVLWVRHGWSEEEKIVASDARAAGSESSLLYCYLPREAHDELKQHIATLLAAQETMDAHGTPSTPESIQACNAVKTRLQIAESGIKNCMGRILAEAKVFLGGGSQASGLELVDRVKAAADDALARLFPRFIEGDFSTWNQVLAQARAGNVGALAAVQYRGETNRHPVCKAICEFIGPGKKGKELREYFRNAPFGWPQDAVDASLILLTLAGNLRASLNGQPADARSIIQSQIGNHVFHVDIPPLTVTQRLDLKALFQKLGIATVSGQESVAAATFLTALLDRAAHAGGESPAPEPPDVREIRALQAESGNAQLLAIHRKKADLAAMIDSFVKAGSLIAQRLPRWNRLQELCDLAEGLPALAEVNTSMSAIAESRGLLSDPDPLPLLIKSAVHSLRTVLNATWQEHSTAFEREQRILASNPSWQKLTDDQRQALSAKYALHPQQPLQAGSEDDIYRELKALPLSGRRTAIEALPHRFAQAAEEAARILAPKAVRVHLPAATVATEQELEEWISKVRALAKEQLKQGPVIF